VHHAEADETIAGVSPAAFLERLDQAAVHALLALAAEAAAADCATLCVAGRGLRWTSPRPCERSRARLTPIQCEACLDGLGAHCANSSGPTGRTRHLVRLGPVADGADAMLCLTGAPTDARGHWALTGLTAQAAALLELHGRLARETVLAGEADHRIKNALQSVASFLRLHERRVRDEGARQTLAAAARQVRAIALLHDEIADAGGVGLVRLDVYMNRLGAALQRLAPDGVRIDVDVPAVTLAPEAAAMIAMITNEFVTNSAKHAFAPGEQGTVMIRGLADANGLVELTLTDDGAGLPATVPKGGLGLRIVEAAARKLGGRLTTSSPPGAGCRFALVFPCRAAV